jgi:hypothetical protein
MLSRQVAPLLRKFCKVGAYFTIASQRGHAFTMLRSFKVILDFSTHATRPARTCSQASNTSTISRISQRRPVTPVALAGNILRLVNAHERAARCSRQTQNDLGGGARRGEGSRFFGIGIKPSRWACFLAALRARRMASAFSRVLRSDGFSYALRRFISRKTPSRCIFFLSTLSA